MKIPPLDPRYPTRPNTETFWRISKIVSEHDRRIDEDKAMPSEVVASLDLDPGSVKYVASQRILRAIGVNPPRDETSLAALIQAVWVDAFAAGVAFEKDRASDVSVD